MNDNGMNDMAERQRKTLTNRSNAMIRAIRLYGFTAVLDIVVRLSNHDEIINHLLPKLPTMANATNFLSNKAGLNADARNFKHTLPENDMALNLRRGVRKLLNQPKGGTLWTQS